MKILDLNGAWRLRRKDGTDPDGLPCAIPGSVTQALVRSGELSDPRAGENGRKLSAWVAETVWDVSREFSVDAAFLRHDFVDLELDAVEGWASVSVNGVPVLRTDNAFRPHASEVRSLLRPGRNELLIRFFPVESPPPLPPWMPSVCRTGVPGAVRLRAWSIARIAELGFSQRHSESGPIRLFIGGWVETADPADGARTEPVTLSLRLLDPEGEPAWEGAADFPSASDGQFHAVAAVRHPRRWWPAGLGGQPLYTLQALLRTRAGRVLDLREMRIGLRTLEAAEPAPGGPVRLRCNGVPVFLKGAVWSLPPAETAGGQTVDALLAAARDAHFNALALTPSLPPPPPAFWDRCDEAGIIVLGTGALGEAAAAPPGPFARMGTGTEAETESFAQVPPPFLNRACVPDSLLQEPGEETGLLICRSTVSLPDAETLAEAFPAAAGGAPLSGLPVLTSPALADRFTLRGGAPALLGSLLARYPLPASPRGWLVLSQLAQADALRARIAAARANDAVSGLLWEPYASLWAAADGASVDASGRWKALQYEAARAFAPEALFSRFDPDRGAAAVFRNDTPRARRDARFSWRLTDLQGATLSEGTQPFSAPAFSATPLPLPCLTPFLAHFGPGNLALWLSVLDGEGYVVARDCLLFAPPKDLRLRAPEISVEIAGPERIDDVQVWNVTLCAAAPAFAVRLTLDGCPALFGDAFFPLEPDEMTEVCVTPLRPLSAARFRRSLQVHSLFDL